MLTFRRSTIFKTLVVLIITNLLGLYGAPCVLAKTTVTVPAGTTVSLKFADTISPATKKSGDSISLVVVEDVVVDGKIVIRAGASARGEVTKSRERNFLGIPAQIGVTVKTVEAVDGKNILLSDGKYQEGSSKMVSSIALSLICCVLFALRKGGETQISQGTEITVTTGASAQIEVD